MSRAAHEVDERHPVVSIVGCLPKTCFRGHAQRTQRLQEVHIKFSVNSVLIQCEGSAKAVSTKGKRTKIADFRVFFHNNHLFKVNKSVDS